MYRISSNITTENDELLLRKLLSLSIFTLIGLSVGLITLLKSFSAPPSILSNNLSTIQKRAWAASRSSYLAEAQLRHQKDFYKVSPSVERIIREHSTIEYPHTLAKTIVHESRLANFDPLLLAAIIKEESTFNPNARSIAGAIGLMQIQPTTGRYVSDKINEHPWKEHKLTDPAYNIRLGIAYFKYLEELFGDKELALVAYNWGPTKLTRALKMGGSIPSGPQSYAKKILSLQAKWQTIPDTRVASLDLG